MTSRVGLPHLKTLPTHHPFSASLTIQGGKLCIISRALSLTVATGDEPKEEITLYPSHSSSCGLVLA